MLRRILVPTIIVTCIVIAAPASAQIHVNVAAGLDVSGSFDLGNLSSSADPGFTLGLELMFEVPIVELGVGFEYGFSRGTGVTDLDASYTHLYGIARLTVFGRLYLIGRLGYHDLSASGIPEIDGGSGGTWGLGAGLGIFKWLAAELIFNDLSSDLDYTTWGARAVITF
jgi:hypothetical protein